MEPDVYINEMLKKVDKKIWVSVYGISDWKDCKDFLEKMARRFGRLKKGN